MTKAGMVMGVAALLCAGSVRGADKPALLARLSARARETRTLQGEFTQRSRVKLFKKEMKSSGRFAYERPGRVRWQFLAPDPSTLIVDGDKATLSMPDYPPQLFDLKKDAGMRAVFSQVELWLGGESLADADRDYVLVAAGNDEAPVLKLTPRPGTFVEKAAREIELRFDGKLLLRTIILREPGGDEKEIEFTKMERNVKLPPTAFVP